MNNLAVAPALSGIASAYSRAFSLPTAAATISAADSAANKVPAAASDPRSGAEPVTANGRSESAGGNTQSERQAQIERQLSRVEAELLRVTQTELRELASRDLEVRTHEQAHKAVGGQYAGAINYSYERGPDGRLYAVGGSVSIDTAPVPGDPAATVQKLQQVQRAALAPAQPSAQDLVVAAQAAQAIAQARGELATETLDAITGKGAQTGRTDQPPGNPDSDKSLAVYRQISAADAASQGSVSSRLQVRA